MSAQSGRLQHALKHLREQWDIAQDTWNDPASRDFERNHLIPLEQNDQKCDHRHGKAHGGAGENPGSVQGRLTRTDSPAGETYRLSTSRSSIFVASLACDTLNSMDHGIMPESPLVQKEAVALSDLEALIADRVKRESETELGFRKRIDREENEYQSDAPRLASKFKVDSESLQAEYRARDEVVQTFQRDTQANEAEYAQTKKQIDDQFKKDQRRAKKIKEEAGWQALAFYEGSRDEGIKWRRGRKSNWQRKLDDLHANQDNAEFLLKRCGKLAVASADAEADAPAGRSGSDSRRQLQQATESTARRRTDRGRARRAPAEDNPLTRCARLRSHRRSAARARGAQASQVSPDRVVYLAVLATWGGRDRRARASAHRSAGRLPGSPERVAAIGVGDRGLDRTERRWHAHTCCGTPCRSKRRSPRPMQLVEQNKDWIKNEFETKMQGAREKGERRRCKTPRAESGRRVAEVPRAAAAADRRRPTRNIRLKLEQFEGRTRRRREKDREKYPPRIAALKEKYADDGASSTSRTARRNDHKQQYDQTWKT